MNIIKSNILSIVCGLLAVLSVAVTLLVGRGLFDDLQGELNKRKTLHTQMEQLLKARRYMPGVDPYTAERIELKGYPNSKLIEDAKAATEQVKQQSQQMVEVASRVNRRAPLVPGALPRAVSQSEAIEFRNRYRALVMGNPPATPPQLRQLLNATAPVTQDDVKAEADRRWKAESEGITRVGGVVLPDAEARARAEFEKKILNLPIEMQAQRAASHSLYVSPGDTAFDVHPGILQAVQSGVVPSPVDIWFAQLGLWVQQDVASAIARANAAASGKGVSQSIVKHLVRMRVPAQYITAAGPVGVGLSGGSGLGASQPPADAGGAGASAAEGGGIPKVYTVSFSGRVCNDLYDVVHFELVVRADATRYGAFLTELSRGQLITILEVQMRAVDLRQAQAAGYFYGDGPVVTLVLRCEALFFRKWTEPLMPSEVKRMLSIGQPLARATYQDQP